MLRAHAKTYACPCREKKRRLDACQAGTRNAHVQRARPLARAAKTVKRSLCSLAATASPYHGATARRAAATHHCTKDAGASAEAAARSCTARTAPSWRRPLGRRGPERLGHAPLTPQPLVPIPPRPVVASFAPFAPASHSRLVGGATAESLVRAFWRPLPALWQWHAPHAEPPCIL
jgi:hypothetical protein